MFHSRVRHEQLRALQATAALWHRRLFVLNTAVCGLLWGGVLCWLVPGHLSSEYLLPAVLIGIGATALSTLSSYLSALYASRAARAAQCAQCDEALGRLAGGVAHDFNNLFTVIIGNADGLREQSELPEGIHTRLTELRFAARRGAELVWQLLAIAGRQRLEPQRVELSRFVEEAEARLSRELSRRAPGRFELRLDLSVDSCWVDVDPKQLEPVLLHLVNNAQDAMSTGGVVKLSTERALRRGIQTGVRQFVVLCVQDAGVGMDHQTLAHAHEPFFTTRPPGNAEGLGLAIVKGIVEQSGGFLEIASSPGAGSSVHVYLPRSAELSSVQPGGVKSSKPQRAEQRVAARLVAEREALRVLVVEDEPGVRSVVARTLRYAGHTVLVAEDGLCALELLATEPPVDLLVTDVRMPRMGGPDLARELRRAQPALPVLFMSGHTFGDVVPECDGRTGFLAKPFSAEALRRKLVELLREIEPPSSSEGFASSQTISARPDNLV